MRGDVNDGNVTMTTRPYTAAQLAEIERDAQYIILNKCRVSLDLSRDTFQKLLPDMRTQGGKERCRGRIEGLETAIRELDFLILELSK